MREMEASIHSPLETWFSTSRKVAIIGGAVHRKLPYMAQGAAVSIEDAAALAEVVSRTHSTEDPHIFSEHSRKSANRDAKTYQKTLISTQIPSIFLTAQSTTRETKP